VNWRTRAAWATGAVLAFTACGVAAQDRPRVADDDSVPFGLLAPNAPTLVPPPAAVTAERVTLCFLAGDKLVQLEHPIDPPVSTEAVVAALREPPPSADETLRSVVGPTPLVVHVRTSGGVAQVDLTPAVTALGGNNQLLAVAQLVCTLTARPGIGQVSFTLNDSPIEVPRGDGSLTSGAVSRDDYAAFLTP
jgi:spore germination protein GerM